MLLTSVGSPSRAVQVVGTGFGRSLAAGFLIGFGSCLGGGCTSGNGICGLGFRSAASTVHVLGFMATGAYVASLVHHGVALPTSNPKHPDWMLSAIVALALAGPVSAHYILKSQNVFDLVCGFVYALCISFSGMIRPSKV